ncbi:MAG: cytochrome c [Myxococcota bacterium]|nr:cytochrome c [Myxococcota bacterium]
MLRPVLVVVFALLVGGPPGLARADEAPRESVHPSFVEAGQALFRQHCAVCHGMEGRGDGVAVSALKTPPSDLRKIAARRGGTFPAGEVATWIDGRFESPAHGSREMPIWGNALRDTEPRAPGLEQEVVRGKIDMLVDYLRTLQVEDEAP